MQEYLQHRPMTNRPLLVPLSWNGGQLVPEATIGVDTEQERSAMITILHTNDLHASVDGRADAQGHVAGGLARITTTIRQAREARPTLVLDAGDFVFGEGTWWNAHGARSVAQLRGRAGCDLATLGNHDLERGLESLQELCQGGFPFVCANLQSKESSLQPHIRPAYIAHIAGWRIGIIGVTTLSTYEFVPRRILQGITLTDPLEATTQVTKALEPLVDTILILSHLGFRDYGSGDYELATRLSGSKVSLILGGHIHSVLDPAPTIGEIMICNNGPFGANVNEVKIHWNPVDGYKLEARLLPQNESVSEDPELVALRNQEAQTVRDMGSRVFSLPPLPPEDDTPYARERERILLARALHTAGLTDPTALLLIPLMYTTTKLPTGSSATATDILTSYPNRELLVEVQVNGTRLKEIMAWLSSLPYYALPQPTWLREETHVTSDKLEDNRMYRVIVTELMLEGGLGWIPFKDAFQHAHVLDICCAQLVLAYLEKRMSTAE